MQVNENVIQDQHVRFTVLTEKLLRIEYSETGVFEDRLTQAVQNRDFPKPDLTVYQQTHGHQLEIKTAGFHLYYEGGPLDAGSLFIDAASNYGTHYSRWYFGETNEKNLKGTARTLDRADGAIPLAEGLMSKDGFSVLDDSDSFILDGETVVARDQPEMDYYYFAYGRDYRATLRAYYQLTGLPPLVPRYALGNWWSRFYPYTQTEYLKLMQRFDEQQVPIAVTVFDMNWHTTDIPAKYGSGWTGYTWNKDYFPDPAKMMSQLHQQGRKVTLNVHPASGIRPSEACYPTVAKQLNLDTANEQPALFDLQNAAFKKAYTDVHHQLEQQGVDFWWIDWQQGGARGRSKIDPLWLLNIAHYADNERQHPGEGLILSRYAGPGSHRYPIGFSGDTVASWASLQFQPYFTATASNIGYTWWSHDIGGHMRGTYDGELALRWLQLGVFSPILRLHSSNNIFMGKEPWNYDQTIAPVMVNFLQLRSQLVPYLDSANDQTHTNGVPLVQPMYYGYPDEKTAYDVPNEFQFGPSMVVAPITTPADATANLGSTKVWLPAGTWYDFFTGLRYQGDRVFNAYREKATYPVFVKAGGIVPLNPDYMAPIDQLPTKLVIKVFTGTDGTYTLVEHHGDQLAKTEFSWDEQHQQFSWHVVAGADLIPEDRHYQVVLVGAVAKVASQTATQITYTQYQSVDQTTLVTQLVKQRLQFAKLDFETKAAIWQAYHETTDTTKVVSYLSTITDPAIKGMLMELLMR
ncbi:glycoside hydrolase family 31 protein [Lactiplantibacillus mudanjiangensis]|uniref:Alpha-xylosidase [Lactobacillus sp.] n=1 Tax=Lactiplantibacillus mudanjiangensis TaxID=1296538 RepID=A0A660DT44_9LACO|nr:glycoside hydrolase family 31 protein [Lactiplantibacillus mudanjiangensis]VDG22850.1 alpha-xylosidase [Lactobacillus sp.] [Lactiplantibacillus mudanjiangensis]VDG26576.1 alpha-xylosidase [Lactobacillus sp.] [Lactiplantibacillus mudanjiangensis]